MAFFLVPKNAIEKLSIRTSHTFLCGSGEEKSVSRSGTRVFQVDYPAENHLGHMRSCIWGSLSITCGRLDGSVFMTCWEDMKTLRTSATFLRGLGPPYSKLATVFRAVEHALSVAGTITNVWPCYQRGGLSFVFQGYFFSKYRKVSVVDVAQR